jgi:ABC-type Na+ efflux pump permease subunit
MNYKEFLKPTLAKILIMIFVFVIPFIFMVGLQRCGPSPCIVLFSSVIPIFSLLIMFLIDNDLVIQMSSNPIGFTIAVILLLVVWYVITCAIVKLFIRNKKEKIKEKKNASKRK